MLYTELTFKMYVNIITLDRNYKCDFKNIDILNTFGMKTIKMADMVAANKWP